MMKSLRYIIHSWKHPKNKSKADIISSSFCLPSIASKLFFLCLICLYALSLQAQRIIYVNDDAIGLNTGNSWADAYTDLQAGLLEAQAGDEIWVANGIYKPTTGTDRTIAFQLKSGVAIYGGFEGIENAIGERDLTKVEALQAYIETIDINSFNKQVLVSNFSATVLSGDIGVQNDHSDNSYSVLVGENVDPTAVLEAIVVSEGNANGDNNPQDYLGGGMYNINGSPTIRRCSFVFSNARFDGGGVYNEGSSPKFFDCSIVSNTAPFGGGFSNKFQSEPVLDNCRIISNIGSSGGGVYNEVSAPSFNDCLFEANQVVDNGGAMNNYLSSATLINCQFIFNEASVSNGGAIYSRESNLSLEFCTFKLNSANSGGGGMANSQSSPSLIDCSFEQNYARLSGGGIFNEPQSSPTLNGCTFLDNTAGINGGGMFNGFASSPKLENCSFEQNNAQNGGGMNNFNSSPRLINCAFLFNEADNGGGMYSRILGTPELIDCIFYANTAFYSGGGIFNESCSPLLSNCFLELNSCQFRGGGMNNDGSSPILVDCTFKENGAGESGGGMANRSQSSPEMENCDFEENSVQLDGGGLYNENSSPKLYGCNFKLNSANSGGGGIANNQSAPSLRNCSFEQNYARLSGGGIFNEPESSPILKVCTFAENIAGINGGGIFNGYTSSPVLDSCSFELNSANDGGGMNNFRSSPRITNCVFQKNEARSNGGGIWIAEGFPFIENSLLNSNEARLGGGIFLDRGQMEIRNSTLSNNDASLDGGGIYNKQIASVISSTLYQNKATRLGESIYSSFGGNLKIRQSIIANEATMPDFYLESPLNITSEGNNLVGNGDGYDNWQPSDIIGSAGALISPMLEPLADNGGFTKTHALNKNSPAVNAGGLLYLLPVDILIDQRGFSRINSSQDSLSDIGAYERHRTEIKRAKNFTICYSDSIQTIDEIILTDPAGGAFAIGDAQTLVFELPIGFSYDKSNAKIYAEGEGLRIKDYSFDLDNHQILITYDRDYSNSSSRLIISGLQAKFLGMEPITGKIVRSGGTGLQIENNVSDSVILGILTGFPTISISQRHTDSFDRDRGNWLAIGDNNLWEWARPMGTVINENGENKAWVTDADNAYTANKSYMVESGCFDYSSLKNPEVNLDIWSDTREGFDGTVLQFSEDRGETWITIGGIGTGTEWYNNESILGNPGGQFKGWSGRDSTWKFASHLLTGNTPFGRFRLVFGSSISLDPNQTNNGFAFDNFSIGEIDSAKTILFEQYTNLLRVGSGDQFIINDLGSLIPIRYFLSKGETFHDNNLAGPRTRALYYGISEPGITVVNGIDYKGPTSEIEQSFLNSIKQNFNTIFSIAFNPTNPEGSVEITSFRDFENEEIMIHMALVENGLKDGDSTYNHVFRKFLPDAAGTSLWGWTEGEKQTFPLAWFEGQPSINSYIENFEELTLVVFVQNQQTKEVYQAASTEVWPELISALEKREIIQPTTTSFALYPNPVSDFLTLQMGELPEKSFNVSFYNLQGAIVKEVQLDPSQTHYQLETKELASGPYYVRVGTNDEIWLQDRVVVIR